MLQAKCYVFSGQVMMDGRAYSLATITMDLLCLSEARKMSACGNNTHLT